jgi:hypothetical protein
MSDDLSWIKARQLQSNPRCQDCGDGKMLHPSHPWGRCWVNLPGGERCPCGADIDATSNADKA